MARGLKSAGAVWLVLLACGCRSSGSSGGLTRLAADLSRERSGRLTAASFGRPGSPPEGLRWFRLAAGDGDPLASVSGVQPDNDAPTEARAGSENGRSRSGPLPGLWETIKRDVRQMPGDLWADTKAVYTSPPNLVILGLTYGGALALQETGPDDTVETSFSRDHHRTFPNEWRDAFGAAGNPGTHFALAGLWYLVGQQQQDEKTYEVGKTLFSALIVNGLSTLAGKAATWEDGPNDEWGAFPSGHTSSSFAFASVMHRSYGPWVGVPLYALSGLVGYERLESGEHYLSDVVMGGVMGLVIGHTVAGEHKLELLGGEVVPYVDPYTNTSGLAWVTHFK